MEAEILAWGEFISIAAICLSFIFALVCVAIIYKKWGDYYEMDSIFMALCSALIFIFCAIMAGIDLYQIKNYPQAYIASKIQINQCK